MACTAGVSTSIHSTSADRGRALSTGVLVLGYRALPIDEMLFSFSSAILGSWMTSFCCNFQSAATVSLELTCDQHMVSVALEVTTGHPKKVSGAWP